MDPNVTGRTYDLMEDDFSDALKTKRVVVLDLSDQSEGNGIGLGNADIITEKVFKKLNYRKTLVNALTSLSLRKAFIPVTLPDDMSAIHAAVGTLGPVISADLKMVVISDTLHLAEFYCSQSLIREISSHACSKVQNNVKLCFNSDHDMDWEY